MDPHNEQPQYPVAYTGGYYSRSWSTVSSRSSSSATSCEQPDPEVCSVGTQTEDSFLFKSGPVRYVDRARSHSYKEIEKMLCDLDLFPVMKVSGFPFLVNDIFCSYSALVRNNDWKSARKISRILWSVTDDDFKKPYRYAALEQLEVRLLQRGRQARLLLRELRE